MLQSHAAAYIVITFSHGSIKRFLEHHLGTIHVIDCLMCESTQPPSDQGQVNILCVYND